MDKKTRKEMERQEREEARLAREEREARGMPATEEAPMVSEPTESENTPTVKDARGNPVRGQHPDREDAASDPEGSYPAEEHAEVGATGSDKLSEEEMAEYKVLKDKRHNMPVTSEEADRMEELRLKMEGTGDDA